MAATARGIQVVAINSGSGVAITSRRSRLAAKAARLALCAFGLATCLRRLGPRLLQRLLAFFFGLSRPVALGAGGACRLGAWRVPAREGALLHTLAYVRADGAVAPTLFVRTPYGTDLLELLAYALVGQGFNVVVQSCRGRFDSTGDQTFAAFEDLDGVTTLDWLASQGFGWYDPARVVMFGISYLGIVQWAVVAGLRRRQARAAPSHSPSISALAIESPAESTRQPPRKRAQPLVAIAPLFAASRVHDVFFVGNAFRLEFYIRYFWIMLNVNSRKDLVKSLYGFVSFEMKFRYWVRHCLSAQALQKKLGIPRLFKFNPRQQSKFWKNRDYSDALESAPPAFIATGWHDLMLESSLRDYESIAQAQGAGHSRLLVGPWHHLESMGNWFAFRFLLRNAIDFLKAKTGLTPPESSSDSLPVRLWVMGSRAGRGAWRDFSAWPPEEAQDEVMFLTHGELKESQSDVHPCMSSLLIWDPRDPTPSIGGAGFNLIKPSVAGEKDVSLLAKRRDVLHFTSQRLVETTTIVGRARLRLSLRTSRPHFDVFARICDVHPSGRSYNVCDAFVRRDAPTERALSHQDVRLTMERMQTTLGEDVSDFTLDLVLSFAGTAKCFQIGHRIQLLVACGHFPQCARNFGDKEQAIEEEPFDVEQCKFEVLHSERTPSTLFLPILRDHDCDGAPPRRQSSSSSYAAVLSPQSARARRRPSQVLDANLRKVQSDAVLV